MNMYLISAVCCKYVKKQGVPICEGRRSDGELHRLKNAHVVSCGRQTTLWSHVYRPNGLPQLHSDNNAVILLKEAAIKAPAK